MDCHGDDGLHHLPRLPAASRPRSVEPHHAMRVCWRCTALGVFWALLGLSLQRTQEGSSCCSYCIAVLRGSIPVAHRANRGGRLFAAPFGLARPGGGCSLLDLFRLQHVFCSERRTWPGQSWRASNEQSGPYAAAHSLSYSLEAVPRQP